MRKLGICGNSLIAGRWPGSRSCGSGKFIIGRALRLCDRSRAAMGPIPSRTAGGGHALPGLAIREQAVHPVPRFGHGAMGRVRIRAMRDPGQSPVAAGHGQASPSPGGCHMLRAVYGGRASSVPPEHGLRAGSHYHPAGPQACVRGPGRFGLCAGRGRRDSARYGTHGRGLGRGAWPGRRYAGHGPVIGLGAMCGPGHAGIWVRGANGPQAWLRPHAGPYGRSG